MHGASAADLPPELFPLIIEHVVDACIVAEDSFVRSVERRVIGQLSLVSSYWAKNCRRHLFPGSDVAIRGIGDVVALNRLLQSPVQATPPLHECLYPATFVLDAAVVPWIEMASCIRLLSNLDFSLIQCKLEHVTKPKAARKAQASEEYAPDSWSHGLPRTLPGSTLHVRHLHLYDLKFPDLASLCRLFDLPTLREVRCRKLHIAHLALPFPRRVRTARPGNSFDVEVAQCGAPAANTGILLASAAFNHTLATPAYGLGWATWAAVHHAACALAQPDTAAPGAVHPDCALLGIVERRAAVASLRLKFLTPRHAWLNILARPRDITHELTLSWAYTPDSAALRAPGTRTVTRLRMKLSDAPLSEDMLALCVRSLRELADAAAPAMPVILDVEQNAQTFAWLVEYVLGCPDTPLRRLHDRRKLRLALSYHTHDWHYAELSLRDVALQPSERVVGEDTVILDPRSRVELCLCTLHLDSEAEAAAEAAYLRWLAVQTRATLAEEAPAEDARPKTKKQREEMFTMFLRSTQYKAIRASSTRRVRAYENDVLGETYDEVTS